MKAKRKLKIKRYTKGEKRSILSMYKKLGLVKTMEMHKVSSASIYRWLNN